MHQLSLLTRIRSPLPARRTPIRACLRIQWLREIFASRAELPLYLWRLRLECWLTSPGREG